MRIDCDQCGAAYSIDDALITERGVRAQCPKCGQQKVVKKPPGNNPLAGGPAPVTAMQPIPNLGANPFGTAPAAANPFATSSAPVGAPPPSPPSNPFAPPAGASPFASMGSAASPMGGAPPGFGPPPAPPANPFGSPDGAPPSPPPFASSSAPMGGGSPFGPPPGPSPSGPPGFGPSASPFGAPPDASPFAPPPTADNPFASPAGAAPQFGFGNLSQLTDPTSSQALPPQTPPQAPQGASPFTPPPPSGNDGAFTLNPFGAAPSAPTADPFASLGPPPAAPDPFAAALGPPPGDAHSNPFHAPSAPAANPFAGGGFGAAPDPFSAAAPSPPPNAARMGGGGVGGGMSGPPALGGGPVADPFAKLDLGGSRDPAPPPASAGRWRVKTTAGMDAEVDLPQLRDLVRGGQVGPNDEAAPLGEPLKPVRSQPQLAAATPVRPPPSTPRVAGARARSGPSLSRVAGALLLIAVVGGVAAVIFLKPELFENQTDAGVNPLRRAKPTWEKQFPERGGTATEHVASARKLMRLDNAAAYRKADDELRKALLVDVAYVPAIAGWVENFANLPAVKADLEGTALAQEAIAYAERREPENVEVKRAIGALKLALGEVDLAQKALTEAQRLSGDGETLLVLAKSHLDRNPQDALTLVQQVRQKDPSLKHALVVEGAAQRRLGDFAAAREALGARLTDDPANTGALKELAKLELDIGNPTEAILALTRLLDAEDRDVEAHLMRAKISYQVLETAGGLAQAEGYLDGVIRNHDTSAGELLLHVLSHAAYVKAELGNLDEALKLGERARATDGGFAPALFVLGRIYMLKGSLPEAKAALEQAVRAAQTRDTFYIEVCRAELARVQALAGDHAEAIRNYEQAIDYDPRYTRAHFGLAATYMSTQRSTQAMTIMRRAFENDPHFERDRVSLTDYPTPRRDLVGFADIFKNTKVPASDESLGALKVAAEGMIRYHAGQVAEAEALEKKALAEDRFNLFALLHLGVIELGDGRAAEAKKHLRLAVETTGTPHAIMRLYLARAELETGELENARKRLQDLIDQEPTLVQATYSLAMLMRQQKLEAQARDELKKVLAKDQDYIPAKRALAANQ